MPETYRDLKFPPLPAFSPAVPSVTDLPNGLRIYLMEDHELPLVSVRAMIRAGAAYEPADRVGLASVVGSVMRTGGTKHITGDALDDELGALAAAIDVSFGSLNGIASASSLTEKLPRVLELFADVLRNPAFPEDKIELARTWIRTGIARRNDQIGQMASRAFQIAMYGKESPFAREPEYATVDAIQRDDVVRFHAKHLRADRLSIGIVGDFDSKAVLAQLRTLFGDWAKADAPLPKIATEPLPIESRRVVFAEKLDVNQTNLLIGGIGVRRDDPDWPALRVGSYVLGVGGFSNRLLKKVRTELGLAYSVGGGFSAEWERLGLFRAVCQTKTGSTAIAVSSILGEIAGVLSTTPPTDDEVANAKEQIQNAEIFDYDSRSEVLARRMTLDYHGYPPDTFERVASRIRSMKAPEVHAALKRHLSPEKLAIVAVGNAKGFDRPLSEFGPVTTLDLSIPEPPSTAAAPAAAADPASADPATGAARVEKLLAAHGGKLRWASLATLRATADVSMATMPGGPRMNLTLERIYEFPSRSRVTSKLPPNVTIVRGVDGAVSWLQQNGQVAESPETITARVRALLQRELDAMLRRLALGELTGAARGDRDIDVIDGGILLATLTVDPSTGLASSMRTDSLQGPLSRAFSDYRDVDGLKIPFKSETKDGANDPVVTLREVEVNPKVDPSIFRMPPDSPVSAPASAPASKPTKG